MWRWAVASEIGTYHIQSGVRLQDAYTIQSFSSNRIFAAVADGAGSAEFSAYGAWIVCRHLKSRSREWFAGSVDLPSDETLYEWIDEIRDCISAIAEARGSSPRQFAATLAAVLVSPIGMVALQIGDSSIVGRNAVGWDVICWPENGEYASTTYFLTDDPQPRLNIVRQPPEHNAFALFTDGVGDLALLHLERIAHSKFFNPMIAPVDAAPGIGRLTDLSAKLSSFLASPMVCDRTQDDKTLVLMSAT